MEAKSENSKTRASASAAAELKELQHVSPVLKKALKFVSKAGWKHVSWHGGFTALHLAARDGHLAAVEWLLRMRGEVAAEDAKHFRPLDYAVQQKHEDVARVLRHHAEHAAVAFSPPARRRSEDSEKLVVPSGLPLELQRMCELVQQRGWSNIAWSRGFTGLHLAAQLGSEAALRYLLLATAEPGLDLQDNRQMRPVDRAKEFGHHDLIAMLQPRPAPKLEQLSAKRPAAQPCREPAELSPGTRVLDAATREQAEVAQDQIWKDRIRQLELSEASALQRVETDCRMRLEHVEAQAAAELSAQSAEFKTFEEATLHQAQEDFEERIRWHESPVAKERAALEKFEAAAQASDAQAMLLEREAAAAFSAHIERIECLESSAHDGRTSLEKVEAELATLHENAAARDAETAATVSELMRQLAERDHELARCRQRLVEGEHSSHRLEEQVGHGSQAAVELIEHARRLEEYERELAQCKEALGRKDQEIDKLKSALPASGGQAPFFRRVSSSGTILDVLPRDMSKDAVHVGQRTRTPSPECSPNKAIQGQRQIMVNLKDSTVSIHDAQAEEKGSDESEDELVRVQSEKFWGSLLLQENTPSTFPAVAPGSLIDDELDIESSLQPRASPEPSACLRPTFDFDLTHSLDDESFSV